MTVFQNINRLVSYALKTGLIAKEDATYAQNRLLELFRLDGFDDDSGALVIGRDGEDCITLDDHAAARGTINYEVACDFGLRLEKLYV